MLEDFINENRLGGTAVPGEFSVNSDLMLEKYSNLLPDYRLGLLFFFQAAERWKATLVDVKVHRVRIEIKIHLPPESLSFISELVESTEILEQLLPASHPVYELAQGYKILSRGNARCAQTVEVLDSGRTLSVVHHDDNTLWKRLPFSLNEYCRMYFQSEIRQRLWNSVPIRIDSLSHPRQRDFLISRTYYGFGKKLGEDLPPLSIFAHFMAPKSQALLSEGGWEETELPVTDPTLPLFRFYHSSARHELMFLSEPFFGKRDTFLIPIRYGTALEPIWLETFLGHALITFQADHLETDLSGLNLVKNEAYFGALEECIKVTVDALRRLRQVQSEYQPLISRAEMLKKAGLFTVVAPLGVGIFLGGPGIFYAVKSMIPKLIYGASALSGFHSYARHIPNPETYTAAMRKLHLSWLEDSSLIETLERCEAS